MNPTSQVMDRLEGRASMQADARSSTRPETGRVRLNNESPRVRGRVASDSGHPTALFL